MALYINATALPDIPADVLEQYPYAWIRQNNRTGHYGLLFAQVPWVCVGDELLNTTPETLDVKWYRALISSPTEWVENTAIIGSGGFGTNERPCVWANHDILDTAGSVYFAKSPDLVLRGDGPEYIPPEVEDGVRYSAPAEWFESMAEEIRRLTETTEGKNTDTMLSDLQGLELSSGGDGGVIPDDGGSAEELPNGEITTFGYIYTGETKTITRYGGVEFTSIPAAVLSKNFYIYQNNSTGRYFIDVNGAAFKAQAYGGHYNIAPTTQLSWKRYELSEDGTVWGDPKNAYSSVHDDVNTIIYTSHDIFFEGNYAETDEKYMEAMTPTTEEVIVKVSNPVEREDEYRITDDTLNRMCHLAQEAAATEELMDPSAALEILEQLVVQMRENIIPE